MGDKASLANNTVFECSRPGLVNLCVKLSFMAMVRITILCEA